MQRADRIDVVDAARSDHDRCRVDGRRWYGFDGRADVDAAGADHQQHVDDHHDDQYDHDDVDHDHDRGADDDIVRQDRAHR
jgi:hypothetical protein